MLRLTLVLGVLVTILGGTGVFATFRDTAPGGPNSVTSGARASAADLQIAPATAPSGVIACGTFADGTSTPQFAVANLQPEDGPLYRYVCLRNNGAADLELTVTGGSLRDIDTLCTGDELAAGDPGCGNNALGELSASLYASAQEVRCADSSVLSNDGILLAYLPGRALLVGADTLRTGASMCVRFVIEYRSDSTETEIQIAQSDQVTWQYIFEGTAS